jgi:ATP-binding cassette, subfamily B, bacterial PglK
MKSTIEKLWHLFDKQDRYGLFLLVFLVILGSFLEILGIGAIIPFIVMLSQPEAFHENPFLKQLYLIIQTDSPQILLTWTICGIIAIYLIKNLYLFGVVFYQSKLLYNQIIKMASRLYKSYLYSPYSFHLKQNSTKLLRNIEMTEDVVLGVMHPIAVCFSEGVVGFFIFLLLVWVNPQAALIITFTLFILLGSFFLIFRKKLRQVGEQNKNLQAKAFKLVLHGLGSIKEVKILGREPYFHESYVHNQERFIHSARSYERVAQSHRLFIESSTIFIILGTLTIFLTSRNDFHETLVSFSLFLVAAVRMMPSANRVGGALSMLQFNSPKLHEIYDQLVQDENLPKASETCSKEPLSFNEIIELNQVSFQYETGEKPAVKDISFNIPKNHTVGFVGSSGAGKTTLIDLIIGVMKPNTGEVRIDGSNIHDNLSAWHRQIGYIPQSIYLADDTIKSNIAFGIPENKIDEEKVWSALSLAQLKDFVQNLPDGLDTIIGEHGTRLSGGQRQRIGNARAVYHEPEILIMDEATAALDNETERAFMDGIESLRNKKTILLIAHRLSTVKNCDKVFFLKEGQLIAQGKFDELMQEDPGFKKMAQT